MDIWVPNIELHPGPPFIHNVTGSWLLAPFLDSTKT